MFDAALSDLDVSAGGLLLESGESLLGDFKIGAGGGEFRLADEEVAVGDCALIEERLAAFDEFLGR